MKLSQIFCSKVENITYLNKIWHTELQKLNTMIWMGKLYQLLIPHLMFDPVTCYFWYQIAKEILKRPIYNTSFLNTIISLSVNFSLFSFYKPFGISFFDQMTNFNVLKWYTLLTTISVIHYFYCLLSANVHEYTNA